MSTIAAQAGATTPLLERALNHVAFTVVAVSGLAHGGLELLVTPDPDSFSVLNHPWQGPLLDAHVLGAPVLLLAVGMLLRTHVLCRLRHRGWHRSRRSGLAALGLLLPMAASGYLLQTVTAEGARSVLVAVHLVTGGVYALVYALHFVAARRRPAAA